MTYASGSISASLLEPGTGLGWKGRRMPSTNIKRTVPGTKKEDRLVFFFGARNRTSLIMRCYSLLVDIVYFNPFRNIRDMTTMTNKSSKI